MPNEPNLITSYLRYQSLSAKNLHLNESCALIGMLVSSPDVMEGLKLNFSDFNRTVST